MEHISIQRVTKENLDAAFNFARTIFKNEEIESLNEIKQSTTDVYNNICRVEYYIAINSNSDIIGIWGIYDEPSEPVRKSAWLGWFGVKENYRRKGIGSFMLNEFEKKAKQYGYSFTRVYTGGEQLETSKKFYEKHNYIFEPYNNKVWNEDIIIGSKALYDEKPYSWNSFDIFFSKNN